MNDSKLEIMKHITDHTIINTHSHHLSDEAFEDFDLEALLGHTYVDWSGVPVGNTRESRQAYLDKVRYKSYFIWLQKGIQQLYDFDAPISADNWDEVSRKVKEHHRDKKFHIDVLRKHCGYEKVILDTYWEPGSDNGHPGIFAPTFRLDPFFYGYSTEARDHDGNSPASLYGDVPKDFDGYFSYLRELVVSKKKQGCVALKCAIAYDRGLDFSVSSKEEACKVFKLNESERSNEAVAAFQNYLFEWICKIAAETGLPLQCHTGMGQLTNTGAMAMKGAIERNPDTKFVLFHCSYPWTGDVNALMHVYPNVFPDLCWLPILSPTAAKRTLHELIEVGTSDKVCWGCDTWTLEESLGALLAFRFVLGSVLEEKVRDGYFTPYDASKISDKIMYDNAKCLYKL